MPFGPPRDYSSRYLRDRDFQHLPYGVLMIAAEAKRAGHDVSVFNLSTFAWQNIEKLIAETPADVFGISAFTANRRGMGALAALIRQHHPAAHITVGGPFVTALPTETLRFYREIDTVIIGEGEKTFLELLQQCQLSLPIHDIPGVAWRDGEEIVTGPKRPRVKDLDALASPFDYFSSIYVMTSRGCPSKCTFCGSYTTWGRKLSFYSVEGTLKLFRDALKRLAVPFIAIKDDTFTAHRRRAMEICDKIIEQGLNFLWSCDSRVDSLDEELLLKMRRAGCQMISLGVETGSPKILETICKRITTDKVLEVTRAAKKYGINIRFYMIVGNRGETAETIQQSIDLIQAAEPDFYSFSNLSFYPGTEEWEVLRDTQKLAPEIFFENDFMELSVATNRSREWAELNEQLVCAVGKYDGFERTVAEREQIAERLPDVPVVHLELANAYYRAGLLEQAEAALNRAENMDFPIKGMIYNQRACIALARQDVNGALAMLECARAQIDHSIVLDNLTRLRTWAQTRSSPAPNLHDSVHALVFAEMSNEQPCFPGTLH